jgi:hypothetical protein
MNNHLLNDNEEEFRVTTACCEEIPLPVVSGIGSGNGMEACGEGPFGSF